MNLRVGQQVLLTVLPRNAQAGTTTVKPDTIEWEVSDPSVELEQSKSNPCHATAKAVSDSGHSAKVTWTAKDVDDEELHGEIAINVVGEGVQDIDHGAAVAIPDEE